MTCENTEKQFADLIQVALSEAYYLGDERAQPLCVDRPDCPDFSDKALALGRAVIKAYMQDDSSYSRIDLKRGNKYAKVIVSDEGMTFEELRKALDAAFNTLKSICERQV